MNFGVYLSLIYKDPMGFTTVLKKLRFHYGNSFKTFVKVDSFRRRLWVDSFMGVDLEKNFSFGHSKPLIVRDNGHFFFPRCQSYLPNIVSLGSLKPYTPSLKPNIVSYPCNLYTQFPISFFHFMFLVALILQWGLKPHCVIY